MLVGDDDLRAACQPRIVSRKLGVDLLDVLHRVAPLRARDVHDVQNQAAAVNMAQEFVSQPRALGCALNQPGDVGDDKALALAGLHHAEVGRQGGEMVVGDLRLCRADAREDRGFADVGETDKPDIRQHLEFQRDLALLALCAALGKAGDLSRRRGEMPVAPAAAPAFAEDEVLVGGHILDDFAALGVAHQRSWRHGNHRVLARGAVHLARLAVSAVFGDEFALVAEGKQGVGALVDAQDDVAAPAAVTAVGSARGDIFFAAEGDGAVSAVSRLDIDFYMIDKHIVSFPRRQPCA